MTEVIYGILREKKGKLTERKATGTVKERERERSEISAEKKRKEKKVRMCEMRKEDSPHLSFPTSFLLLFHPFRVLWPRNVRS